MEQNKTGTYKLAERILADARDLAEQTEMKANMSAMDIASESVEKCGDLRREFRRKREAAVQSVLDGSRTRALIDGRKAALKRKRVLIDSVFDRAYEALCALNPQRRSELCASLLRAETESGETIIPAAADRAVIEKILSDMNRSDLTLSDENAPIDGGFLLVGKSYEKDCSFHAILDELRDKEETAVAKLLFD